MDEAILTKWKSAADAVVDGLVAEVFSFREDLVALSSNHTAMSVIGGVLILVFIVCFFLTLIRIDFLKKRLDSLKRRNERHLAQIGTLENQIDALKKEAENGRSVVISALEKFFRDKDWKGMKNQSGVLDRIGDNQKEILNEVKRSNKEERINELFESVSDLSEKISVLNSSISEVNGRTEILSNLIEGQEKIVVAVTRLQENLPGEAADKLQEIVNEMDIDLSGMEKTIGRIDGATSFLPELVTALHGFSENLESMPEIVDDAVQTAIRDKKIDLSLTLKKSGKDEKGSNIDIFDQFETGDGAYAA